jgi:hypothetical protein
LCVSGRCRPIKCFRQFIQLDLVRIRLCRVWARVTHQALKSHEIAPALAKKPIGEAVTELVRGEATNARAPAHAPDHPHQRLRTRRLLRILLPPNALMLRDPLLDFDREEMIVQVRRERPKERAKLVHNVRIERQPLPVVTLSVDARSAAHKV